MKNSPNILLVTADQWRHSGPISSTSIAGRNLGFSVFRFSGDAKVISRVNTPSQFRATHEPGPGIIHFVSHVSG
jgi:hypothetical protein